MKRVDTETRSRRQPANFTQNLAVTAGLAGVLAITFALYVQREADVDRANQTRINSLLVANELRQSSRDLTRMARSFVATGDENFRKYYQTILDVRDGRTLRPVGYLGVDADLFPSNDALNASREKPISLLDLMRQAGFTPAEFNKVAEAKANSDALTRIEFVAMNLAATGGPDAAANRARATEMLYDDVYNRKKASIIIPIDEFALGVDRRTQAAVDHAMATASLLRYAFIAVGLILILMLWTTYASLRKMMGGSVNAVHHQIAALGSGNFIATSPVKLKHRESVLGWLSAARVKLDEARISSDLDAADRARAEEALRQSEQRTRLIIDSALDAVISIRSSGAISDWSAQAEKMFGWSRVEAIGQQLADMIIPQRLREAHSRGMKKFLATGEGPILNKRIEVVALSRDGREFPVELAISPSKVGEEWTFSAFIRDLTEQKKIEEAARLGEQRYRALFEDIPVGLYRSTPDGNLIDVNPALVSMLGYPSREALLTAPTTSFYIDPTDRLRWTAQLAKAGVVRDFEVRMRRADGEEIWVTDTTHVKRSPDGRVLFYEGVLEDITDRVETEGERNALEAQLRQSSKMEAVGKLAGGVAHDFNNLLTVIMSYSAMIIGDLDPSNPLHADLREISAAAERAAGLTRQLLAFSRQQVMQPRVLDINVVVRDVENMLRRIIGEDIELLIALDADVDPIHADPGQLEQVIMNLVVNSRDAMPTGGRLTISTSNSELSTESAAGALEAPDGAYVMLSVGDTGTGMQQDVLQRLFDPFFTTKDQGRGTGLGLSTVYGIVKQSGGEIYVYSEVGHGSTFKVYFPRYEGAEVEKSEARTSEVPGGTETLLLVEDDDNLRNLVARVLTDRGYTVLVAAGGVEALAIAGNPETLIDAVISDVVMSGMNGRQVVEKLLEARPGIGVLLMSGYTDDDVLRRGVLHGETAFLQKPFTPDQLTRKVRGVLDRALVSSVAFKP